MSNLLEQLKVAVPTNSQIKKRNKIRKHKAKNPNGQWRRNNPEREFCAFAANENFWTIKRGWPDFICTDDEGIFFVEVKPDGKHPDRHQKKILTALSAAGFRCFVWTPAEGLVKW